MVELFAQTLFNNLPTLDGLTPDDARRMLSRAYLAVIELRTRDAPPGDSTVKVMDYLRRLADTVEFYAVLDETVPSDMRQSGAFVAAEALALLADFYEHGESLQVHGCRLRHNGVFTRIEAGILYIVARYDACAAGVVGGITSASESKLSAGEAAAEWCLDVLSAFCEFRMNPLPDTDCPVKFKFGSALGAVELENDTVGRLYAILGQAVSHFLHRLAGESKGGAVEGHATLKRLLDTLEPLEGVATEAGVGGIMLE
jgi:hypothetical protein